MRECNYHKNLIPLFIIDLSHLGEVREYMREALEGIDLSHLTPDEFAFIFLFTLHSCLFITLLLPLFSPNDEASFNLWGLLEIEVRRNRQLRRVNGLLLLVDR